MGMFDKVKTAAGSAAGSVASAAGNLKERALDKLKDTVEELNSAFPEMPAVGFRVNEIELEIGLTPKLIVRVQHIADVDAAAFEDVLARNSEKKIFVALVGALQEANQLSGRMQFKGYRFSEVIVELGLPPALRIRFAAHEGQRNNTEPASPSAELQAPAQPAEQAQAPSLETVRSAAEPAQDPVSLTELDFDIAGRSRPASAPATKTDAELPPLPFADEIAADEEEPAPLPPTIPVEPEELMAGLFEPEEKMSWNTLLPPEPPQPSKPPPQPIQEESVESALPPVLPLPESQPLLLLEAESVASPPPEIRFRCPTCNKKWKAAPEKAGRQGTCKCGRKLTIPG